MSQLAVAGECPNRRPKGTLSRLRPATVVFKPGLHCRSLIEDPVSRRFAR